MPLIARRYDTSEPVAIELAAGRIERIAPLPAGAEIPDELPFVAPGLVDLQVNGWGGREFNDPQLSTESVAEIVASQAAYGVTQLMPTCTTDGFDVLCRALARIARACEESADVARRVAGIHLEGPYISPHDGPRGAHPAVHVRKPDWDEFQRLQEAAGGRIRIVTLSAEYAESAPFIARAVDSGVIASIGHTAGTPEDVARAVDAGARMSTHLGNGSHPLLPRHSNYLWAQLADDRLHAGLICDGFHLPPYVVKTILRAKTLARCFLVSDVVSLAGLPPGRYRSHLVATEVLPSGKLVVADRPELLAGASQPLCVGVGNAMQFAGLALADAVRLATAHPRLAAGLPPRNLRPGDPADLVLFHLVRDEAGTRFQPLRTLVGGEAVTPTAPRG